MQNPPYYILCKIFIAIILLADSVLLPGQPEGRALFQAALASGLLLVILFTLFRQLTPVANIIIITAVFFLGPLVTIPVFQPPPGPVTAITEIVAAAAFVPLLYPLDIELKEKARRIKEIQKVRGERRVTRTFTSLGGAALVIMVISPVTVERTLLFSGTMLMVYLLVTLAATLFSIPRSPFGVETLNKRILAGTRGNAPLSPDCRAKIELHVLLKPTVDWLNVSPESFVSGRRSKLDLEFIPPLAGQCSPQIQLSAIDPRGFIQVNQSIEPLRLHIIPRAEYAAWLARKFLEKAGPEAAAELMPRTATRAKRGVEYRESRDYQPGDPLRAIDWKHTLKLSQMIVREFHEASSPAVIIAVNLAVTDAGAADRVAFNLITAALTLAREGIPAALAAYNDESVKVSTGIIPSEEILRQTLSLVKEITRVNFTGRRLEAADIPRIRRNINRLRQTGSEPALRLSDILDFERQSLEIAAKDNPATLALLKSARRVPAPAMILLVSQLNHDAEAVFVTIDKLRKRKYTAMPVDVD
ncbi:MAG: hypothetical protein A2Z29_01150 [Chloroflexi bacterium RBG_16_56_11]|nr:MAG: hypothetical protein A2Z29_01150 [Chloroflexi bacterium RBG_16_56_11]